MEDLGHLKLGFSHQQRERKVYMYFQLISGLGNQSSINLGLHLVSNAVLSKNIYGKQKKLMPENNLILFLEWKWSFGKQPGWHGCLLSGNSKTVFNLNIYINEVFTFTIACNFSNTC